MNALASFTLVIFFVVDTYLSEASSILEYTELVLLISLALDFLLFFFISDNRLLYIFSI
jgi:hypothetical protein